MNVVLVLMFTKLEPKTGKTMVTILGTKVQISFGIEVR